MPGSQGAGRQGLKTADDRGGMDFQGETVGTGAMPRVRKELAKGSLVAHRQTQHGVAKGGLGQEGEDEARGNNVRTYRMAFTANVGTRPCPVKGCSGQASTQTAMRVQLWHRHVRDTGVVLEEGNLPHPRCPLCDMLVPWK